MQRQPEEFALVLSLSGSGYSGPKLLWFLGGGWGRGGGGEEDKCHSLMVGQFTPSCPVLSLSRNTRASVMAAVLGYI